MANPKNRSASLAGVFNGHAPEGYTELTVADTSGLPMLRVFARTDLAERYELEKLAYSVLDSEVPRKLANTADLALIR